MPVDKGKMTASSSLFPLFTLIHLVPIFPRRGGGGGEETKTHTHRHSQYKRDGGKQPNEHFKTVCAKASVCRFIPAFLFCFALCASITRMFAQNYTLSFVPSSPPTEKMFVPTPGCPLLFTPLFTMRTRTVSEMGPPFFPLFPSFDLKLFVLCCPSA